MQKSKQKNGQQNARHAALLLSLHSHQMMKNEIIMKKSSQTISLKLGPLFSGSLFILIFTSFSLIAAQPNILSVLADQWRGSATGYDAFAQTKDAQQYLRDHAAGNQPFIFMLAFGEPHFPHATAPEKCKAFYPPRMVSSRARSRSTWEPNRSEPRCGNRRQGYKVALQE